MTFREFWPLYLQAHSHPLTRAVHYGATVLGIASTLAALVFLQPLFLLGIGVGYALAIGSHALIERNRSLIGVNPVWGAIADVRMFWLAATGRLRRELDQRDRRLQQSDRRVDAGLVDPGLRRGR